MKSVSNNILSFSDSCAANFSLSFLFSIFESSAATFKNTSSKVGIDALYVLIPKFFKLLSKSSKNFVKSILLFSVSAFPRKLFSDKAKLSILSSLFVFSAFFGIRKRISSDNISYSIFFARSFMKSIILSLSAPSSFVIFKLMNLPKRSIKNKGVPMHFILPAFIIPILFPKTLASSI